MHEMGLIQRSYQCFLGDNRWTAYAADPAMLHRQIYKES